MCTLILQAFKSLQKSEFQSLVHHKFKWINNVPSNINYRPSLCLLSAQEAHLLRDGHTRNQSDYSLLTTCIFFQTIRVHIQYKNDYLKSCNQCCLVRQLGRWMKQTFNVFIISRHPIILMRWLLWKYSTTGKENKHRQPQPFDLQGDITTSLKSIRTMFQSCWPEWEDSGKIIWSKSYELRERILLHCRKPTSCSDDMSKSNRTWTWVSLG